MFNLLIPLVLNTKFKEDIIATISYVPEKYNVGIDFMLAWLEIFNNTTSGISLHFQDLSDMASYTELQFVQNFFF